MWRARRMQAREAARREKVARRAPKRKERRAGRAKAKAEAVSGLPTEGWLAVAGWRCEAAGQRGFFLLACCQRLRCGEDRESSSSFEGLMVLWS